MEQLANTSYIVLDVFVIGDDWCRGTGHRQASRILAAITESKGRKQKQGVAPHAGYAPSQDY